jgi:hypothetical protein
MVNSCPLQVANWRVRILEVINDSDKSVESREEMETIASKSPISNAVFF